MAKSCSDVLGPFALKRPSYAPGGGGLVAVTAPAPQDPHGAAARQEQGMTESAAGAPSAARLRLWWCCNSAGACCARKFCTCRVPQGNRGQQRAVAAGTKTQLALAVAAAAKDTPIICQNDGVGASALCAHDKQAGRRGELFWPALARVAGTGSTGDPTQAALWSSHRSRKRPQTD